MPAAKQKKDRAARAGKERSDGPRFLLRGSAGVLCIYIENARITIGNSEIALGIMRNIL